MGNENVWSWREKAENPVEVAAVSMIESSPQRSGESL